MTAREFLTNAAILSTIMAVAALIEAAVPMFGSPFISFPRFAYKAASPNSARCSLSRSRYLKMLDLVLWKAERTGRPRRFDSVAKRLRKEWPKVSTPTQRSGLNSLRGKGLVVAGTQGFEPQ